MSAATHFDPHATLTLDQKRQLYRDGYIILRDVIPRPMVDAARARIANAKPGDRLATETTFTDLVNATAITPMLHEAMGQFDPPRAAFVAVNKVRKATESITGSGYRECDIPYFGAEIHMDGLLYIPTPQTRQDGSPEEIYRRYIATGPKGDIGRSADVMGSNMVPLFQDPAMTLGIGSFSAFVIACLNDQPHEGCGSTAVLPGAHHLSEQLFRTQRDVNDHLGPEGPYWPRMNHDAPNRCGLNNFPDIIRNPFIDADSLRSPDGRPWPKPTHLLMRAGDVAVTVYHIPHSATRNELGTEPRQNVIFRLRNKRRQPNKRVNGVTDHPDRGQMGEWLEYEPGNDPWARSKHALCNQWEEWEGLADVVREAQAAGNPAG